MLCVLRKAVDDGNFIESSPGLLRTRLGVLDWTPGLRRVSLRPVREARAGMYLPVVRRRERARSASRRHRGRRALPTSPRAYFAVPRLVTPESRIRRQPARRGLDAGARADPQATRAAFFFPVIDQELHEPSLRRRCLHHRRASIPWRVPLADTSRSRNLASSLASQPIARQRPRHTQTALRGRFCNSSATSVSSLAGSIGLSRNRAPSCRASASSTGSGYPVMTIAGTPRGFMASS